MDKCKSAIELFSENPKQKDFFIKNEIIGIRDDGKIFIPGFPCKSESGGREKSDRKFTCYPFYCQMFENLYERLGSIAMAMNSFDRMDTSFIALNDRIVYLEA